MNKPSRTHVWLARLWILLVLVIAGHNVWLWAGGHARIDTDVLAMLPQNEQDPALTQATRHLADMASSRVVVLVGGKDWPAVEQASDTFAATLTQSGLPLSVSYRVGEQTSDQWLSFFAPYRASLLTPTMREKLATQTPQALADQAVQALYQPMGMPRIGAWRDDPLNLFGNWLSTRASESRVRVTDGRLSLADGDKQYALLMVEQPVSAFSTTAQAALSKVLIAAKQKAVAQSRDLDIVVAGIPLFAAAAAEQAQREIHTIGVGSLIGIIVLTLFAFSALRPRILVTLSIAVGLITAISVCSLIFTKLHLITLVFGASLVGVAENYGTNYFSNRLGAAPESRWAMLREQGAVMWLAMLTTAIGYLLLALTPFPGLRQMALFSAIGLLASFLTVLLWFPFLDSQRMDFTRFARWLGSRRACWPAVGMNAATVVMVFMIGVVVIGGMARLHTNDDIRSLQSSPPELIAQQLRVGKLLDMASPGQFYLVRGASEEEVLTREEALKQRLDPLVADGWIRGYQAISDWVPSASRQRSDAAAVQRLVFGPNGVYALASAKLGEDVTPAQSAAPRILELPGWLASPVSEPLRFQWLGQLDGSYASVVMIRGLDSPRKLARLAAIAPQVAGVRWVDKVAEVSAIMGRYRLIMAGVIGVSYLLVFAALSWRFGRRAWRAIVPSALASALAIAVPAWFGLPLQLFSVLALLLILSMGVDYGIFMLEQPSRSAVRPFLSVTLAAASTLLSFGLLALSHTPALRAFGLTMLLGISFAWFLLPFFLPSINDQPDLLDSHVR